MRILESSQTLLHVLKKEDTQLCKKKLNVSTRKQQPPTLQSSPEKNFKRPPVLGEKTLNIEQVDTENQAPVTSARGKLEESVALEDFRTSGHSLA